MSDLIDRQAAIEDIRTTIPKDARFDIKWIEMWLMQLPPAQPEIIRCKDCKYAHLTKSGECKYCDAWTDDDGYPLELYEDGDFFCGRSERKDND